jgi:hypothetical protein
MGRGLFRAAPLRLMLKNKKTDASQEREKLAK